MNSVVTALPVGKQRSERERVMERRIADIIDLHEQVGFSYQGTQPIVRYGLPDGNHHPMAYFTTIASYVPEEHALYVNFEAIVDARKSVVDADARLQNAPQSLQSLGRLAKLALAEHPLLQPTTELELREVLSRVLGLHHLQVVAERDDSSSWLLKQCEKEHELFSQRLIQGGVCEYFARIVAPSSESISSDIWKRYNEDPELAGPGRTQDWFASKGGYTIVAPFLNQYRSEGLLYLLKNQLRINRHFGLMSVPRYRREGLKVLADRKAA